MAKRVFFSFHYQDVVDFRANVVRKHHTLKEDRDVAGYHDASIWEDAKKQGEIALKRLINSGLDQTTNTCVLIGTGTYARPWVRYELLKSFKKGNHIFGVHINSIKGKDGKTKDSGRNPLDYVGVRFSDSGMTATMYEWIDNSWVEYSAIDGSPSFRIENWKRYGGDFYQLSKLYKTYDWALNDGYNNFPKWLG